MIVIETEVVAEPWPLVAVTVYDCDEICRTDGVPLIAPVDVSKLRPDGNAGLTDQDVTVLPLYVGVFVVIAVPFSRVMLEGE